ASFPARRRLTARPAAPTMAAEPRREGVRRMEQPSTPARACPACGGGDYLFRGRKQLPADEAAGRPAATESQDRCRAGGHGRELGGRGGGGGGGGRGRLGGEGDALGPPGVLREDGKAVPPSFPFGWCWGGVKLDQAFRFLVRQPQDQVVGARTARQRVLLIL